MQQHFGAKYVKSGGIVFNPQTRSVFSLDGTPIDLPDKSLRLLVELIDASPRVVSLEDMQRKVWGSTHVSAETVRQRVKLLRAALVEAAGEGAAIRSVHGEGYAIDVEAARLKSQRLRMPNWLPLVLGAMVMLSAGLMFFLPETGSNVSESTETRVSISPFVALNESDTYLAAGFTGDLIDKLLPFPGVTVSPLLTGLGNHADYILEGSVRRGNNALEVKVRMLETTNNEYLWSKDYNYTNITDVFAIQASIAGHVALITQSTMDETWLAEIEAGVTDDSDAFYAYLLGRGLLEADGDIVGARAQFIKALTHDPKFDLARKALADLQKAD